MSLSGNGPQEVKPISTMLGFAHKGKSEELPSVVIDEKIVARSIIQVVPEVTVISAKYGAYHGIGLSAIVLTLIQIRLTLGSVDDYWHDIV